MWYQIKWKKTINVEITQYYLHKVLKKYVKTSSRFMTHDELEEAEYGDLVEIKQSRPISKRKHWVLHKILKPRKYALISQENIYKTPLDQLKQQLQHIKADPNLITTLHPPINNITSSSINDNTAH